MQLTTLHIGLKEYGSNEGKYEGQVRFKGQHGATEILLDPTLSEAVLKLCADSLVKQAQATANMMAGTILEAVKPALENKE